MPSQIWEAKFCSWRSISDVSQLSSSEHKNSPKRKTKCIALVCSLSFTAVILSLDTCKSLENKEEILSSAFGWALRNTYSCLSSSGASQLRTGPRCNWLPADTNDTSHSAFVWSAVPANKATKTFAGAQPFQVKPLVQGVGNYRIGPIGVDSFSATGCNSMREVPLYELPGFCASFWSLIAATCMVNRSTLIIGYDVVELRRSWWINFTRPYKRFMLH